tara:strand:- start:49021 stop:49227 length:207 start_codon:yes stop_codon:yes gene_type:complete
MDKLLREQAHTLAEKFTELECKTNDFTLYDGDNYSRVAKVIYEDYFNYAMDELKKLKMEILSDQINKN